ncbi:aspartate carbamoyltransferase [Candidatus Peregrinibacteria bacterium]|nr:aspartate carbamoyltransferase [Candidatus Peregrinibacteria bacterium]MBT3598221.1 aspartate carbamoyltransferase [Candidatus Peregrinibacteria bacterium]MBT4367526.1 aspartate carbamoyltransferase [Candidatus Peregrinibacteria bacterium]MBT4585811.1 aspartate carbamoyltransferase [Candidatus Peregrinibacteria bacterium]MBT6730929.1 aspartate carbamoyltransferase [Candidatus Peregrinibacteria bacterium]
MLLPFKHLTSTKQLTRDDTDAILKVSKEMEEVLKKGGDDRLAGKILACLFYEPSTRTRLSFESAMHRLGGDVLSAVGFQFSSLYKGETIEDTITVMNEYADIITMRHPEGGSADKAASVSEVPFINAGDGPRQHPTQALLDLYTIQKEKGSVDGTHITMVGDLLYGRTVHSLSFLLGLYDNMRFTFVSPKELKMSEKVTSFLTEKGINYTEVEDIEDGLDADVLYMTRVQKERFADQSEYERLKLKYVLTADMLKGKDCTIMHPLPRVGEIDTSVDALPNAAYFREAGNGVIVRMALLCMLLDAV